MLDAVLDQQSSVQVVECFVLGDEVPGHLAGVGFELQVGLLPQNAYPQLARLALGQRSPRAEGLFHHPRQSHLQGVVFQSSLMGLTQAPHDVLMNPAPFPLVLLRLLALIAHGLDPALRRVRVLLRVPVLGQLGPEVAVRRLDIPRDQPHTPGKLEQSMDGLGEGVVAEAEGARAGRELGGRPGGREHAVGGQPHRDAVLVHGGNITVYECGMHYDLANNQYTPEGIYANRRANSDQPRPSYSAQESHDPLFHMVLVTSIYKISSSFIFSNIHAFYASVNHHQSYYTQIA